MTDTLNIVASRFEVVRNGAATEYNLAAVGDSYPTVTMAADGEIKTSLHGVFEHNDNVDYLNDEIRPYYIKDGIEYPLGVYMIGTLTTKHTKYGKNEDTIEAYDRALKLKQTKTESRHYIAAGTPYMTAIQSLIRDAGIPRIQADGCTDTLATDREDWEIGTEYLTIINALLSEINFSDIWFDFDGVAHLEKYEAPSSSNIDREYRDDAYSIITPEYTEEMDIYEAPNVFIVNVSNPDYDEPMTATGVNDSMISALSTVRRGRRILATPVELDNIASQAALQKYADNLAIKSMFATQKIKFFTAINPAHGVGDVIALYNGELVGVYEETDWKIEIRPGALMEHQAKKVVFV